MIAHQGETLKSEQFEVVDDPFSGLAGEMVAAYSAHGTLNHAEIPRNISVIDADGKFVRSIASMPPTMFPEGNQLVTTHYVAETYNVWGPFIKEDSVFVSSQKDRMRQILKEEAPWMLAMQVPEGKFEGSVYQDERDINFFTSLYYRFEEHGRYIRDLSDDNYSTAATAQYAAAMTVAARIFAEDNETAMAQQCAAAAVGANSFLDGHPEFASFEQRGISDGIDVDERMTAAVQLLELSQDYPEVFEAAAAEAGGPAAYSQNLASFIKAHARDLAYTHTFEAERHDNVALSYLALLPDDTVKAFGLDAEREFARNQLFSLGEDILDLARDNPYGVGVKNSRVEAWARGSNRNKLDKARYLVIIDELYFRRQGPEGYDPRYLRAAYDLWNNVVERGNPNAMSYVIGYGDNSPQKPHDLLFKSGYVSYEQMKGRIVSGPTIYADDPAIPGLYDAYRDTDEGSLSYQVNEPTNQELNSAAVFASVFPEVVAARNEEFTKGPVQAADSCSIDSFAAPECLEQFKGFINGEKVTVYVYREGFEAKTTRGCIIASGSCNSWNFSPIRSQVTEREVLDGNANKDGGEKIIPEARQGINLDEWVEQQQALNRTIVAVQGLGFVGQAMASVIANAQHVKEYAVIGIDLPSNQERLDLINRGISPIKSDDPKLQAFLREAALHRRSLIATTEKKAYSFADIIVMDVPFEAEKPAIKDVLDFVMAAEPNPANWLKKPVIDAVADLYAERGKMSLGIFENAVKDIASFMKEDALVIIETTVAPGTTDMVAFPVLERVRAERGFTSPCQLAHSYERVTPGPDYLESVYNFPRQLSARDKTSELKALEFFDSITNTARFPVNILSEPIETELAKVLENTYRSVLIAMTHDFDLLAEHAGANLHDISNGIRVRPTHSNMLSPTLGVGGYCLPKDALLALYAAQEFFGMDLSSCLLILRAVAINDLRALRAVQFALKGLGCLCDMSGARVSIMGVSYKAGIGDTRYSPSETACRAFHRLGALVSAHDSYVDRWDEIERDPDINVFFSNGKDIYAIMREADVIVFAVNHREYASLDIERLDAERGFRPGVIIDAYDVLDDAQIKSLLAKGYKVFGYGKGHIRRLQSEVGGRAVEKYYTVSPEDGDILRSGAGDLANGRGTGADGGAVRYSDVRSRAVVVPEMSYGVSDSSNGYPLIMTIDFRDCAVVAFWVKSLEHGMLGHFNCFIDIPATIDNMIAEQRYSWGVEPEDVRATIAGARKIDRKLKKDISSHLERRGFRAIRFRIRDDKKTRSMFLDTRDGRLRELIGVPRKDRELVFSPEFGRLAEFPVENLLAGDEVIAHRVDSASNLFPAPLTSAIRADGGRNDRRGKGVNRNPGRQSSVDLARRTGYKRENYYEKVIGGAIGSSRDRDVFVSLIKRSFWVGWQAGEEIKGFTTAGKEGRMLVNWLKANSDIWFVLIDENGNEQFGFYEIFNNIVMLAKIGPMVVGNGRSATIVEKERPTFEVVKLYQPAQEVFEVLSLIEQMQGRLVAVYIDKELGKFSKPAIGREAIIERAMKLNCKLEEQRRKDGLKALLTTEEGAVIFAGEFKDVSLPKEKVSLLKELIAALLKETPRKEYFVSALIRLYFDCDSDVQKIAKEALIKLILRDKDAAVDAASRIYSEWKKPYSERNVKYFIDILIKQYRDCERNLSRESEKKTRQPGNPTYRKQYDEQKRRYENVSAVLSVFLNDRKLKEYLDRQGFKAALKEESLQNPQTASSAPEPELSAGQQASTASPEKAKIHPEVLRLIKEVPEHLVELPSIVKNENRNLNTRLAALEAMVELHKCPQYAQIAEQAFALMAGLLLSDAFWTILRNPAVLNKVEVLLQEISRWKTTNLHDARMVLNGLQAMKTRSADPTVRMPFFAHLQDVGERLNSRTGEERADGGEQLSVAIMIAIIAASAVIGFYLMKASKRQSEELREPYQGSTVFTGIAEFAYGLIVLILAMVYMTEIVQVPPYSAETLGVTAGAAFGLSIFDLSEAGKEIRESEATEEAEINKGRTVKDGGVLNAETAEEDARDIEAVTTTRRLLKGWSDTDLIAVMIAKTTRTPEREDSPKLGVYFIKEQAAEPGSITDNDLEFYSALTKGLKRDDIFYCGIALVPGSDEHRISFKMVLASAVLSPRMLAEIGIGVLNMAGDEPFVSSWSVVARTEEEELQVSNEILNVISEVSAEAGSRQLANKARNKKVSSSSLKEKLSLLLIYLSGYAGALGMGLAFLAFKYPENLLIASLIFGALWIGMIAGGYLHPDTRSEETAPKSQKEGEAAAESEKRADGGTILASVGRFVSRTSSDQAPRAHSNYSKYFLTALAIDISLQVSGLFVPFAGLRLAIAFLTAGLFSPVWEEILIRKWVMSDLFMNKFRLGAEKSVILSSLSYAVGYSAILTLIFLAFSMPLHPVILVWWLVPFLGGVIFACVYVRTNSLAAAMAVHGLFNVIILSYELPLIKSLEDYFLPITVEFLILSVPTLLFYLSSRPKMREFERDALAGSTKAAESGEQRRDGGRNSKGAADRWSLSTRELVLRKQYLDDTISVEELVAGIMAVYSRARLRVSSDIARIDPSEYRYGGLLVKGFHGEDDETNVRIRRKNVAAELLNRTVADMSTKAKFALALRYFLSLPELEDWSLMEVVEVDLAIVRMAAAGDPDRVLKQQSTATALSLLERQIIPLVQSSADRLEAALRMAVFGNAIDSADPKTMEAIRGDPDFVVKQLGNLGQEQFWHTSHRADLLSMLASEPGVILYVMDNAGEDVWDMPLLNELTALGWKVIVAAKRL
ncbi:MAG: glycoside hydrolase family 9 protein, partial [Candidatus Omnitrophica bacterium]|nr:glycoside hydrolase family 9 protein [Candidatus Omnitrophota bacterium]